MDHAEATRIQAPERYLHGELTPPEAEAFEEHFFCCQTCAEELKLEDAFAQNVKAVFEEQPRFAARAQPRRWWDRFSGAWNLGFAVPAAAAACLLLIAGFQNLVTI